MVIFIIFSWIFGVITLLLLGSLLILNYSEKINYTEIEIETDMCWISDYQKALKSLGGT